MMGRRPGWPAAVLLAMVVLASQLRGGSLPGAGGCDEAGVAARLRPDYAEATIPPNIAPLTFVVKDPGRRAGVRVSGPAGAAVQVVSHDRAIRIPMRPWRALLAANRGRDLRLDVYVQGAGPRWQHFDPVVLHVSTDPVDPYLAFRVIGPGFNLGRHLMIRQRDLESYAEQDVIDNATQDYNCVNCHTFLNNRPDTFLFHVRGGGRGPAMVIVQNGKARRVDAKVPGMGPAGVSSWHPSGRWVAFSVNIFRQVFHTAGVESREVADANSGIYLYSLDTGRVSTTPELDRPDRLETLPTWTPDGRTLYFVSSPRLAETVPAIFPAARRGHYDLVRVPFDPDTGSFGRVERVLAAADAGKTILEPRISPDGRFLLATFCGGGALPTFEADADIYLIDLRKPGFPYRRIESVPESQRDTWHSWSSTGRWVAFSRRSVNGMLNRPYLRHIDAEGNAAKAFEVPQADPTFHDRCTFSYNVPELLTGPVRVDPAELARAVRSAGG